jgi:hypothetical protein
MPDGVRQARIRAQQIDFEQMRKDCELLEELAALDLKTGRKSLAYRDQRADFMIRQRSEREVKAELSVKKK